MGTALARTEAMEQGYDEVVFTAVGKKGGGTLRFRGKVLDEYFQGFSSEPTFADAILDRIVHNAYRLELDGPSIRKTRAAEEAATDAAGLNATTTAKPTKGSKK